MSLNLKNAETNRLVRELAVLTGESMTQAVTEAVRERLERLRADREALIAKWSAIADDCAAHMSEPYLSIEHGDLLYDEWGLPK